MLDARRYATSGNHVAKMASGALHTTRTPPPASNAYIHIYIHTSPHLSHAAHVRRRIYISPGSAVTTFMTVMRIYLPPRRCFHFARDANDNANAVVGLAYPISLYHFLVSVSVPEERTMDSRHTTHLSYLGSRISYLAYRTHCTNIAAHRHHRCHGPHIARISHRPLHPSPPLVLSCR